MKSPKKKKPSISSLKKKVDLVFKKFIRLRDGKCLRCGTTQALHASHTIPVSHGNRLRYDEENVITLCFHCHKAWWHAYPTESGKWFKKTFPKKHKYIERVKNERKKFTIEELQELYDHYKEEVEKLEKKLKGE